MNPPIDPRFIDLCNHLWRGGAYAHWWAKGSAKQSIWFPVSAPADISANWLSMDLYFTVNALNAGAQRSVHRKSHIDDVAAVNCLYAEFDDKNYNGNAAAHLTTMPVSPSVTIRSGGGIHAYWLLEQPWRITDEHSRASIDSILKRWVALVRGDVNVSDLARVLRIPGTMNHKYQPARPVEIDTWKLSLQYDIRTLADLLPPIPFVNVGAAATVVNVSDGELLDLARNAATGMKFDRLWNGIMTDYGNDHSTADLALCTYLAFWTGKDQSRMDALFRQSALMREKWDRRDYREGTLEKACHSVTSCYAPGMDSEAVKAAMAAVGIKRAHTNGATSAAATQSMSTAASATQLEKELNTYPPNDDGNALAVLHIYGHDFVRCEAYGWLYWTGTHWKMEAAEDELRLAVIETLKLRQVAAVKLGNDAVIRTSKPNWSTVRNCIEMLRARMSIDVAAFDADPDLLNVANGVLNLRTGWLDPHMHQYFTYCIPVEYDPNADYVEWIEFLATVIPDLNTIAYLQQAAGYSITGHTREEALFFLYGPTRAGKGTLTEILLTILTNPLGHEADFTTFTAERKGDTQNFDLAPLKPARLIVASESAKYETLNEAKVKAITGGNWIRCAFKHHDHFEYRPQFKIWLVSNHPVKGDVDDDAFWGRIRVIEFPNSFLGKEDKLLKSRLKTPENLRGVLRWIVEGAGMWYANPQGLQTPPTVVNTTQARRTELDYMQQWLDDCCRVDADNPALWTANTALYTSYVDWCRANGVTPKGQQQWGRGLAAKKLRVRERRYHVGKTLFGTGGIVII